MAFSFFWAGAHYSISRMRNPRNNVGNYFGSYRRSHGFWVFAGFRVEGAEFLGFGVLAFSGLGFRVYV